MMVARLGSWLPLTFTKCLRLFGALTLASLLILSGIGISFNEGLSTRPQVANASTTLILRPNAAGDETSITTQTPNETSHYDKVDEASPDNATTSVNTLSTSYQRDLYAIPNHTSQSGTINFVKVYVVGVEIYDGWIKVALKSGSTVTDGSENSLTGSWAIYSQQWDVNPTDNETWSWADIDGLQIGVSLKSHYGDGVFCTQVYVEVDYTRIPSTYYVATDGDNDGAGSIGDPWQTLSYAALNVIPGDNVSVRGGTYAEQLIMDVDGTADGRITFSSYPAETPIIDGDNVTGIVGDSYDGVVRITASYITFQGFEVKNNADAFGVFVWRSEGADPVAYVIVKDNVIHDCHKSGIYASGGATYHLDYFTADGNEIHTCNQGGAGHEENISLTHVYEFEIKYNHLHDNLQEGIDAKVGSSNGTIHDNHIEDSALAIYIGGWSAPQSNIAVYNNLIHDGGIAFGIDNETGTEALTDIDFYNNLAYNITKGFLAAAMSNYDTTFRLINNTFYNISVLGIGSSLPAINHIDCVMRNNIVVGTNATTILGAWNTGDGLTVDHNLWFSLSGTYYGSNKYGTDYVLDENPLLTNPPTDFSIPYDSPARNAGSATSAPATDYAGTARPQDTLFDMGAYENDDELIAPTITVSAASNIEGTTATINGNVTDTGGENSTVTVYWGDNDGGTTPGNWDHNSAPTSPAQPQGAASFYYNATGLAGGTTHYFNASANNTEGTSWGSTQTFLTKPAAPTGVSASDGSSTSFVVVTWTKSTGATGYDIYRNAGLIDSVGDVATYNDNTAGAPTITAGASAATNGTSASYVQLSLSGTSANNGTSYTYGVVATNATGDSSLSATNTGYRGVGALIYQWQRSSGDSDADYSNISGATTAPYNDTGAPENGDGRYYKCILNATGATQQITSANRGYREVGDAPLTIDKFAGLRQTISITGMSLFVMLMSNGVLLLGFLGYATFKDLKGRGW